MSISGTVINLNAFGATVRLVNGEIAHAAAQDVEAHRRQYERSLSTRSSLAFVRGGESRRTTVALVPQISDERLEEHITSYLKSTEESEGELPAHERHFLRKKRRAAQWEAT